MAQTTGDDTRSDLVDPIPRPKSGRFSVTMRPQVREVVFLDNGKPNSLAILHGARDEMRRRGIVVREEILTKSHAGLPVGGELLGVLSSERGLLLAGVND